MMMKMGYSTERHHGGGGFDVFSLLFLVVVACFLESSYGQSTGCIEELQDIWFLENLVFDTSVQRTYVLCPRRIFEIGTLDYSRELQGFGVHPPLPIKPNMHIKCGEDGLRTNLCWIVEGDVHIDATPYLGLTEPRVDNVVIEGITFIDARRYGLWAAKPGHIKFIDCEFRVSFQ